MKTLLIIIMIFGLHSFAVAYDYPVNPYLNYYASVDFSSEYFFMINSYAPEPIGIEVFSYNINKELIDVTEVTRYNFIPCPSSSSAGRCAVGSLPAGYSFRVYIYYFNNVSMQEKILCQFKDNNDDGVKYYCPKPIMSASGYWFEPACSNNNLDACTCNLSDNVVFGSPVCGNEPYVSYCPWPIYYYDLPYDVVCGDWFPQLRYQNQGLGSKTKNTNRRMKAHGERGIGGYEKNY